MLPVLVLFFVASASAAPGLINIKPVSQNDVGSKDNSLIGIALDVIDGGELTAYTLIIEAALNDLSRSPGGQALAAGQAIALLGELSTGRPGDSCTPANLINAYARYVSTGNSAGVREALGNYAQSLASDIDSIARLVSNPESARYASGPRGSCAGEGRTYQIDAAWDSILGSATPDQIGIVNEEYCTAKRLYCANSARSNNIGAQITASALPPSVQVFKAAGGALSNFLKRVGTNDNVWQAAATAKQALLNAVSRVNL